MPFALFQLQLLNYQLANSLRHCHDLQRNFIAVPYFSSIRSSLTLNNFCILLKPAIPNFTCFCSILFHFHFHPDPKYNEIGITISRIPLTCSACNQTPCITHNTQAGIVSPPYCPSHSMNEKATLYQGYKHLACLIWSAL